MKRLKIIPFFLIALSVYACDDIFEQDISKSKIDILAPKSNSVVKDSNVKFIWDIVPGADRYRITIVSPSFKNINRIIADEVIIPDSLAYIISFDREMPGGNYEWRLKGENTNYQLMTGIMAFSVENPEEKDPESPEEPEIPEGQ